MPITKSNFACGHRGLGGYCHRCKQAEVLEARAKNHNQKETSSVDQLVAEANRLRAMPTRQQRAMAPSIS